MGKQKTAMVLGGIHNHRILVEKLKERGFYTILVDYLEHPPAAEVSHEHVPISIFDQAGIEGLARERKVDLIINCCLEHVNTVICRVAQRLKLPMMYSEEVAVNVSDKKRMKTILKENHIPTTDFCCVNSVEALDQISLRFPVFVKPTDGSGSTGVNKAMDGEELRTFAQLALECSKRGEIIVEEEARGKECNVYCVVRNGKAQVLLASEKYSEIRGSDRATKAIGSLTPAVLSQRAMENISTAAQQIADRFHLKTTPMFLQVMVQGDEFQIIEFACRMAGGYSYRNVKQKLNFDYFDFTIDAFLGREPQVEIHDTGVCSSIHSIYATPCILDRVEGFQALQEQQVVSDYLVIRDSGTRITDESANREKIGFFLVKGQSVAEVLDRVKYVFEHLEAYDVEGRPVLRKNLYLTPQRVGEQ